MGEQARSLAVWCPDWPVVAAGTDPSRAAIVVAEGRVQACTAAAREAGIRRGQRLRDAQRFCPDVVVHDADPGRAAVLFEQVVRLVEEVAPRLEVIRPGLLAVPVRGAARYHGGEAAVATQIRDAVIGAGFAGAVGIADGAFAAVLAARRAWDGSGDGVLIVPPGGTRDFLEPHPVAVLEQPELVAVLLRLGVRTVGDLAALPARDVLVRFGAEGVAAHRSARGLSARPPVTRPPGEDLAVEHVFEPAAESSDPVVFAGKALADELHARLGARGVTCVRVEVDLVTAAGRRWTRLWRHDGRLGAGAVAERVRWQLDGWRTDVARGRESVAGLGPRADSGAAGSGAAGLGEPDPVVLLRLAPDQLVTDTGTQLGLWGRSEQDDRVARAAGRLQAMLGHAGVGTAVLAGGRGPGERVVRVPWGDVVEPDQPGEGTWPGRLPDPLPVVVDPFVVEVLDPEGAAVRVSARGEVSAEPTTVVLPPGRSVAVTGWVGPWSTVERWWDPVSVRRAARFQCTTADGRAWLLMLERGQWQVEGRYC